VRRFEGEESFMEYEIEQEVALFDPSTNPSLRRKASGAAGPLVAGRTGAGWHQKAEFIPEEEDQLA
jgi:hypothetical protein